MKSFTDVQQSQALAEILPIESADFFWIIGHLHTDGPRYEIIRPRNEVSEVEKYWPCWSLAALLEAMPSEIDDNYFLTLEKEGNEYCCCYQDINGNSFRHEFADNPVDACYEMILKLHEQMIEDFNKKE